MEPDTAPNRLADFFIGGGLAVFLAIATSYIAASVSAGYTTVVLVTGLIAYAAAIGLAIFRKRPFIAVGLGAVMVLPLLALGACYVMLLGMH